MTGILCVPTGVTMSRCLASALVARQCATWFHEVSHLIVAHVLGYKTTTIDLTGPRPSVSVSSPNVIPLHSSIIRHAGWLASLLLSCIIVSMVTSCFQQGDPGSEEMHLVAIGVLVVAMEAIYSDLLSSDRPPGRWYCGNFGLIILNQASAKRVHLFLHRMLRITMMRGAQSAGLVTYQAGQGIRRRVGSRTASAQLPTGGHKWLRSQTESVACRALRQSTASGRTCLISF